MCNSTAYSSGSSHSGSGIHSRRAGLRADVPEPSIVEVQRNVFASQPTNAPSLLVLSRYSYKRRVSKDREPALPTHSHR
jgi:hypothetical protein